MADAKPSGLRRCDPTTLRGGAEIGAHARFCTMRAKLFRRQLDCAVALAVDEATVQRWESGAVRIPAWAVEALVMFGERMKAVG